MRSARSRTRTPASSTFARSTSCGSRAGSAPSSSSDIFNVFDKQDSIRNQDLVAGAGGTAFGEPIRFQDPRRFYLGARFTF